MLGRSSCKCACMHVCNGVYIYEVLTFYLPLHSFCPFSHGHTGTLQRHLLKWFSLFTINSLLFILCRICCNVLNCLPRARHIYKHNWQLKLISTFLLELILYFSCILPTTSLKSWSRTFCCLLLSALTTYCTSVFPLIQKFLFIALLFLVSFFMLNVFAFYCVHFLVFALLPLPLSIARC